ncbi:MAG: nitronate monooxygenase [Desulfobacterales bacterium]
MKKTAVCDLLSITYPVLQGGMLWLADAGLAAAVSNAGGLGVISPLAGASPSADAVAHLSGQIQQVRTLTAKPLGINLPLDLRDVGLLINAALEQGVDAVITAAGDPAVYTGLLKSGGITVLHVVSTVKHAKKAEEAGADAVIAEGVEAAARNGFDESPLFSLLPQVVDAVDIPVIAAGGIADARGMAAAFALGAQGIQMGTRFLMTRECIANADYKKAILAAGDTDTIITLRKLIPSRSLKNTGFTHGLLALEQEGASSEELKQFLGHAASRTAGIEGDLENGEAYCGASAGLINDIPPVKSVIDRMVADWDSVVQKLL